MLLLRVKRLSEELLLDLLDTCFERRLNTDAPFDGLAAVHDGRVVVAVQQLGDRIVGRVGVLLHEVHRDLAREGKDGLT